MYRDQKLDSLTFAVCAERSTRSLLSQNALTYKIPKRLSVKVSKAFVILGVLLESLVVSQHFNNNVPV